MDLLISQEEIEGTAEEARQRFVEIEQICRKRHYEQISGEQEWALVRDSQLRYMNTVVSAAKYLKINPISAMAIPKRSKFDDALYEDFVSELQFYIVQLMLEGAERNSQTSIILEGSTKDRLATLCSHLRDQIKKLDLSPAKIDQLLRQLGSLENELERPRLRFVVLAGAALVITAAIADIGGAATTVRQLLTQIEEAVGKAKERQDSDAAAKKIPKLETRQLEPPTRPEHGAASVPETKRTYSNDLDDDIPF